MNYLISRFTNEYKRRSLTVVLSFDVQQPSEYHQESNLEWLLMRKLESATIRKEESKNTPVYALL